MIFVENNFPPLRSWGCTMLVVVMMWWSVTFVTKFARERKLSITTFECPVCHPNYKDEFYNKSPQEKSRSLFSFILQGVFFISQQPNIWFSNRFFLLKTEIHTQILNTKPFLCDFLGLRYLQNKMRWFWSKLKLFDL